MRHPEPPIGAPVPPAPDGAGGMLAWLAPDGRLILAARAVRTFAYGFQAVLLGVYLDRAGWAPWQVGAILTATCWDRRP